MTTPWDRIDAASEDAPAFKKWLESNLVNADEFNGYDLTQRFNARTLFGDQQQHQQRQLQRWQQFLQWQQRNTVAYERKSISEISENICNSVDKTSTSQMGWRREWRKWIEAPIFLREHHGELKKALDGLFVINRTQHNMQTKSVISLDS